MIFLIWKFVIEGYSNVTPTYFISWLSVKISTFVLFRFQSNSCFRIYQCPGKDNIKYWHYKTKLWTQLAIAGVFNGWNNILRYITEEIVSITIVLSTHSNFNEFRIVVSCC